MKQNSTIIGMALGFIGVVSFAVTLPATKIAVGSLSPTFITVGRAAAAGILAVITILVVRPRLPDRQQLFWMVVAAPILVLAFPGLVALGLQTASASHGGIVLGIIPFGTAAASAILFGERLSARFWFFAILGTIAVVTFAIARGDRHAAIGDVYLFAAAILTSVGYAVAGHISKTMAGWKVICWILILMLPITWPSSYWLFPHDPSAIPRQAWIAFGYVSLVSMFLGFFAWNAGLAIGGIARVSQLQLLQLFFTLGMAALINGETIDRETILVAIFVVFLIVAGQRRFIPLLKK